MRNIEIKAAINDFNAIKSKAQELSGSEPKIIQQVDTFYANISNGRLKLREFSVRKIIYKYVHGIYTYILLLLTYKIYYLCLCLSFAME